MDSSEDVVDLYLFLFHVVFLDPFDGILSDLVLQLVAIGPRLIPLGLDKNTLHHTMFEIPNALLVLYNFLALPPLKLLHLLLYLALILHLMGTPLHILVTVESIKQAVVGFRKLFKLVAVVLIFPHQLPVLFIQTHILLVPSFYLLVIPNTVSLHLLDSFLVPSFFDTFDLADSFLNSLSILNREQVTDC